MPRYDAIVIGAGHNGLICAGYLVKHGLRVLVIERSQIAGGCVRTEEIFPGFRVNTYSFEQYLIHATPIIQDLQLSKYGLEYYTVNPVMFSPFKDRKYMLFSRNVKETIKFLEKLSYHDAREYRKLVDEFEIINNILGIFSLTPPPSFKEIIKYAEEIEADELLQLLLMSAKEVLDERFETEYIKVPIAFLGPAAIGLPPSQKGTGWTVGWHMQARNLARPYGGAGRLIDALIKMITTHGGDLMLKQDVKEIITHNEAVHGVKLNDGRVFESRIVVSACDPRQTFLRLISEDNLDSAFIARIKKIRIANGIAMKADFALDGVPRYSCLGDGQTNAKVAAATYIAPSLDSLEKSYDEYKFGYNPKEPGLMVALHTPLDPSLAPPGKHILSLETRYTPYKLRSGEEWDEIKNEVGERLLEQFSEYAPNVKKLVRNMHVASPLDWERELNLPKGNFMHVDMTIDQLFSFRPIPEISRYRTPISNLYITGAGTHPGGGVSGIPGRNAAMVILRDLGVIGGD